MPHCNADIIKSLTVLHFVLYSWKITVFWNVQETRFSQRSVISCLRQTNWEQQWNQATFEIPAKPKTTQKLCLLVYSVCFIHLFLCLHSLFSCSSIFLYDICCFYPLTFNCIFLLLSLRSIWGAWRKCMCLPQCWGSFWVPYKGLVHPKIINLELIHP